ncbi:PilX N-terminal domain-containing pilus assembly protein [Planctomycetota bacterium]
MNIFLNEPRIAIPDPRHGMVLIVVLGVLALMSILAITFVSLTRLERSISKNYVDRTKAIMIAESGIENAIIKIQSFSGVLSSTELADMTYNPSAPEASLQDAEKPSFAVSQTPPAGINGTVSGFVGPGTYIAKGDFYKLKVEDESGKLNLNDSDNLTDPGDSSTGRLSTIVRNLAELIFSPTYGQEIGTVVVGKIMQKRNDLGGQFSDLDQIREALITADITDRSEQDNFLRNVTLWSWRDPNTLKPQPAFNKTEGVDGSGFHQDPEVFNYPATEALMSSGDTIDDTYGDDIYMNSQFQHKGLELEPRSPVNINTASRELIQALLMGIQGLHTYEYGHERLFRSVWSIYGGNRGGGSTLNAMMNYPLLFGRNPLLMHTADLNRAVGDPPRWISPWFIGINFIAPDPDERRFVGAFSPGMFYPVTSTSRIGLEANFLGNGFGSVRRTAGIDEALAEAVSVVFYDHIHTDNKPFGSWQEFQNFVYGYFDYHGNYYYDTVNYGVHSTGSGEYRFIYSYLDDDSNRDLVRGALYQKFQADAILANFCPNSDLNDFNPNKTLWRFTDKNDLLHYTTEFCFEPTGTFSIRSEGYVLGPNAQLHARQMIHSVIKVFETARITTQAQFLPEPTATMIENQPNYFGNNQSQVQTAGMNSSVGAPSWQPMYNGPLTQSYPEPLMAGEEERISQAHYDGYVCLASNQVEDLLGTSGIFRVSFNGTLDADEAVGDPTIMDDPEECPTTNRLLFTPGQATDYLDENDKELKPGNIHVDGGYSEAYQTLMYHSIDNFGNTGNTGSLLFWVKPNWQPERSPRPRKLFSMSNMNKSGVFRDNPAHPNSATVRAETSGFCLEYIPQGYFGFEYNPLSALESSAFISGMLGTASRSFIFGYGGKGLFPNSAFTAIHTNVANTIDYPDLDTDKDGILDDRPYPNYDFLGHRWNFIAMSWNSAKLGFVNQSIFFRLNDGVEQVEHQYSHGPFNDCFGVGNWHNAWPIDDGTVYGVAKTLAWPPSADVGYDTAQITPITTENPMRFGEYARGMPNYSADATFDEILCLPEDFNALGTDFELYYQDGRYYNNIAGNEPATYTTGRLNARKLSALAGGKSFLPARITLRSLSWTVWWPDTYLVPDNPDPKSGTVNPMDGVLRDRNVDAIPSADMNPNDETDPYYPDRPDPLWAHVLDNDSDNGPGETWATDDNIKYDWDPITVDIELPDESWLFAGDSSYPNAAQGETGISYAAGTRLTMPDGRPIRLQDDDGIRLRFFFNEKQDADQPLHETPVLDDITITFIPGKPTVIRWQVIN